MDQLGNKIKVIPEFWKGKNVFITGHTGFKGVWLTKWLLMMGANVTGYSLKSDSKFDFNDISGNDRHPYMKSIFGNIIDFPKLRDAFIDANPEIVFHLAAQPLVRESYMNPIETYETNVMGTLNLLEVIRISMHNTNFCLKSMVNVTTDKVYENKEQMKGYIESDNLCGSDPYSNSKSCSELITTSYKKSFYFKENFAVSTARAGNVLGGGDYSKDRIIPDCLRAVQSNEIIKLRNPKSVRPYQFVLDCIYGYLLLAQLQYKDMETYEGCYNFGPLDIECVQTEKLVNIFCNIWNETREIDNPMAKWECNLIQGSPENGLLILDTSKARNVLGWNPKYNIQETIKETLAFAKLIDKEYNQKHNMKDIQSLMTDQINKYFSI